MTNPFESFIHEGLRDLKPYQAGKSSEELKREFQIDDIIKLASNENPLGYSDSVKKAIQDSLNDLANYPDSNCYELKQSLSTHWGISTDTLTISCGSDSLIPLLMKCFCLATQKKVLYSQYSFISYKLNARILALESIEIPSKDWGVDVKTIIKNSTENVGLIFITNPNNPTGSCLTHADIEHLLSSIPSHVMVVLDEAYYEYVLSDNYPEGLSLQKDFPNLILLRTFSKSYGLAGLRIGYAIAHPDVSHILNRVLAPFSVNRIAQTAAIAALKDQDFIAEALKTNQHGMQQYVNFFKTEDIEYIPSSANFITMDCGAPASEMYQLLLQQGIIVRPLLPYNMPNHLRISIGTPTQNQRVIDAIKTIRSSS